MEGNIKNLECSFLFINLTITGTIYIVTVGKSGGLR